MKTLLAAVTTRRRAPTTLLRDAPPNADGSPVQRARIVPRSASDRAVKTGGTTRWWDDLYHQLLALPWGFLIIVLARCTC